jgi:tetratricopeptide (TPR) repeat protein
LKQRPAPHPNWSSLLSNLANALSTRFKQKGDFEDLEESIQCNRKALELRPAPHSHRSESLNNLADTLLTRFKQKGDFEDLEEAIQCNQKALDLFPAPHSNRPNSLNNLANALLTRFVKQEEPEFHDLQQAIASYQEALHLLPTYHPYHSISRCLGIALMKLHSITSQPSHLEDAMNAFRVASNVQSSSVFDQFYAGAIWAINAHSSHASALDAYQHTIALLPRLATLSLDLQARQKALR